MKAPVKAGRESRMQESHKKGIADHLDPESCSLHGKSPDREAFHSTERSQGGPYHDTDFGPELSMPFPEFPETVAWFRWSRLCRRRLLTRLKTVLRTVIVWILGHLSFEFVSDFGF
jgi:hypothetical protein